MKDTKWNYLFRNKRPPSDMTRGPMNDLDLMPEWGKYMPLYKFNDIFLDTKMDELLNIFGRRQCKSCIEFNTGTELEEDPRKVRSWPMSPQAEKDYLG
jgi:hypothetical protein